MNDQQESLKPEWVQPYRGPFNKELALKIATDLKESPVVKEAMIKLRDEAKDEWDVVVIFN